MVFLVITVLQFGIAQEGAATVEAIEICTNIVERQPIDTDTVFASTVERLYCFTKLTNAAAPTTVSHVWYYNDKEMAKVELAVKGETWRTWSSKRIVVGWSGKWRVDVVAADGTVLKSKAFTLQ